MVSIYMYSLRGTEIRSISSRCQVRYLPTVVGSLRLGSRDLLHGIQITITRIDRSGDILKGSSEIQIPDRPDSDFRVREVQLEPELPASASASDRNQYHSRGSTSLSSSSS